MQHLPVSAGVGLRAPHHREWLERRPAMGWLEVHAENYLGGGPARRELESLRQDYPVSLHAVGLSLGSAEGLDEAHLDRVSELVQAIEPAALSDHLSWSVSEGLYLPDLLPLPLTEESLSVVARNIDRAQERIGRPLLIENPSLYLAFRHSPIPEPEFLGELARRTGCGLLLDLNNLYVSACNLGFDAGTALAGYPRERIAEIHLAGHAVQEIDGVDLRIDDHGSAVPEPVWALYECALDLVGPRPTLIEWDTALPPPEVLLDQAELAQARLRRALGRVAA
ncbi:MAG TPA: DUF692 domain-containing protein [Methylomirabilota bacterium]|jgi:uncharacterized protein (UPF0276 family)|nr:DUF692 domain-containing protein [Methylomirabilota bacterium]